MCLKYPRLVNVVVTSGYRGVSFYAGSLLFHSGEGTMVGRADFCVLYRGGLSANDVPFLPCHPLIPGPWRVEKWTLRIF